MDEFLNTDNIDIMTMNSDEISFVILQLLSFWK